MSVTQALKQAIGRGLTFGNDAPTDRIVTLRLKVIEGSLGRIANEPKRFAATHREEERRNTAVFGLFLMSFFAESENIVQNGFTGAGSSAKDITGKETRGDIGHVVEKGVVEAFILLIRLACRHLLSPSLALTNGEGGA